MGIYESIWVCMIFMSIYGYVWVFMGMSMYKGLFRGISGYIWVCIIKDGYVRLVWVYRGMYRYTWLCMVIYG